MRRSIHTHIILYIQCIAVFITAGALYIHITNDIMRRHNTSAMLSILGRAGATLLVVVNEPLTLYMMYK